MTASAGTGDTVSGVIGRDHMLMVLLVAVFGAASIAFAQWNPLWGGFGWDGKLYGAWAQDPYGWLVTTGLSRYHIQRILPSLLVNVGLTVSGASLGNLQVIRAFQVLDAVMLVAVALMWKPIADALGLRRRGRWLGFIALFVNYSVLKYAFWLPVLTDVSAFAFGTAMLWCFVANHRIGLAAVTALGSFVWPTLAPMGLALLVFPKGHAPAVPADNRAEDMRFATIVAAAGALAFSAAWFFLYVMRGRRLAGMGPVVPSVESLAPVGIALAAAYLFFAYRTLLAGIDLRYVVETTRSIRPRHVALGLLAYGIPKVVLSWLANPAHADAIPLRSLVGFLTILSTTRPGLFFVSHVVWFGPLILLAAFYWRAVCRVVRAWGPGAVAVVGFGLLLSMLSESRQSVAFYPFVVALVCVATDRLAWRPATMWAFVVVSIVGSKWWLRFGVPASADQVPGELWPVVFKRHFASMGPWMPNDWFAWQALAVLGVAALFYAITIRSRSRTDLGV